MEANELMNELCEICIKLVRDKGVKHSSIISKISETLEEESDKCQKILVLYNCVYGHFHFSKHFQEYTALHISHFDYLDDHDMRVVYANRMSDYGRFVVESYPIILEFVRICECLKVKKMIELLYQIHNLRYVIINIKQNWRVLEERVNGDNMIDMAKNKRVTKYTMIQTSVLWETFPKERLIEAYNNKDGLYTDLVNLHEIELKNLMNHELITALPEHFIEFFDSHIARKHYYPEKRQTFMSVYILGKDDPWQHQRYFNKDRMSMLWNAYWKNKDIYDFLISMLEDFSYSEDWYPTIGLMAASGQECKLEMAHIPCFVDWRVEDCDGMEEIVLL